MKLALRFALRDLRGGVTGLRLLAICLFLGVAGLAGVGSLTSAIGAAISEQGQALLGGDIEYKILQREANSDERDPKRSFLVLSRSEQRRIGCIRESWPRFNRNADTRDGGARRR